VLYYGKYKHFGEIMKFRFFAILTGALLASGCAVQEYSGDREAARWMG
jgi:hypothetical protein